MSFLCSSAVKPYFFGFILHDIHHAFPRFSFFRSSQSGSFIGTAFDQVLQRPIGTPLPALRFMLDVENKDWSDLDLSWGVPRWNMAAQLVEALGLILRRKVAVASSRQASKRPKGLVVHTLKPSSHRVTCRLSRLRSPYPNSLIHCHKKAKVNMTCSPSDAV